VGATAPLCRWSSAEAQIHEADRFLYEVLAIQAEMLGLPLPETCEVSGTLRDETVVRAGSIELCVLHTPGHTPGNVSFFVQHESQRLAFTGDTLFRRGIGRTDLWGGDREEILRSLRNRLLTLADDTIVVPGHGPRTSIGDERRGNPFLRGT
jgi:glyoxylase-like metal-dependent hydrolase (beta-lactamase superfamily II)